MPLIKSAKKRVRTTEKATARNQLVKRRLREATKSFQAAVAGGKSADISKARNHVDSVIDTAAKKNILHKNKAARKKSQVAKIAKAAGAKPIASTKVKTTAKPAAKKKPVTKKKATTKKPAAKKTTTKAKK